MREQMEASSEQKSTWKAVFTVVERGPEKKFWVRIGTAFVNSDQSINVTLDAMPVNGRLNIRDPDPYRKPEAPRVADASPASGLPF